MRTMIGSRAAGTDNENGRDRAGGSPFCAGLLSRLRPVPGTLAIVHAARIGDFICATPAFRALRSRLPETRFTLIGMPFHQELVERNRNLDEFELFPGFPGMAEQFFDARTALAFFDRMQRRRFDIAVQMHGSGVYSNPFTLMLGARCTAGFIREGDSPGRLDAAMIWPASSPAASRALALAEFLGAPSCGSKPEFGLLQCDHEAAEEILSGCRPPFVGLHHGSREPEKLWPAQYFAAAGQELNRVLNGTVLVLGGPQEAGAGNRIAEIIGSSARNLAGLQSLGEMGAVISRLSILVTNDSGPAHMAYALSTPSVTLFGGTDPAVWGPPPSPRHSVLRAPAGRLSLLRVEQVVAKALETVRTLATKEIP